MFEDLRLDRGVESPEPPRRRDSDWNLCHSNACKRYWCYRNACKQKEKKGAGGVDEGLRTASRSSLRRTVDVLSVAGGGGTAITDDSSAWRGSGAWMGAGRPRFCTTDRDVCGVKQDWGV